MSPIGSSNSKSAVASVSQSIDPENNNFVTVKIHNIKKLYDLLNAHYGYAQNLEDPLQQLKVICDFFGIKAISTEEQEVHYKEFLKLKKRNQPGEKYKETSVTQIKIELEHNQGQRLLNLINNSILKKELPKHVVEDENMSQRGHLLKTLLDTMSELASSNPKLELIAQQFQTEVNQSFNPNVEELQKLLDAFIENSAQSESLNTLKKYALELTVAEKDQQFNPDLQFLTRKQYLLMDLDEKIKELPESLRAHLMNLEPRAKIRVFFNYFGVNEDIEYYDKSDYFEIKTYEPQAIDEMMRPGFMTAKIKQQFLLAMDKAIKTVEVSWSSTNKLEKLTKLQEIQSQYIDLLTNHALPSDIDNCLKSFIREVSVARDGSKNAKTKSSEAFFNGLNAYTKNYVFGLMGSAQGNKTWNDFVELVDSGRALAQDMSLRNLTNKEIEELYDSVIQNIRKKYRQLQLSEPIDKLRFLCGLNGITAYEVAEKNDGFKLIAKKADIEKIIPFKEVTNIYEKLDTLNIYNAMTKAIESLEKDWSSGERDTKIRNLKKYRDEYMQMSHQEGQSQDAKKCLKDFIQEAARARNTFLGGRGDAKTNSTVVFFNHLEQSSRYDVFDALGKANLRNKDLDSFIDVLNKEREKTVAKNIAPINEPAPTIQQSLVAAMEKAIGNGWFSGEKTQELNDIKKKFSNQMKSEEDKKRFLLGFIKVAAEPRGFKTVSFGQTKSCVKFFEALDEQSKQYVFEALNDKDNYHKDFQSFVEAIQKHFPDDDSNTHGLG